MIDLRKEFKKVIDQYGHYVLLQRTSRKIRCRCWSEILQEGDVHCKICLGKGRISRIERHKVRFDSAIQIISRPSLNELTPVGRSWIDAKTFYFMHDVGLQVDDVIFEVGWDKNRPTHLIRSYVINDTYDYRGENGRIEYKMASVKAETSRNNIRNISIRSLGPIKNYEIVH